MAGIIIGIDEVGRGPLAGPVVVAALALPKGIGFRVQGIGLPLRDSKRLSPKQRETWFCYLKKHPRIIYATARVYPRLIDKINITNAANRAATKALQKLIAIRQLAEQDCKIFLDGGLRICVNPRTYLRLSASTIIGGDEKIPAISLASIIAKVTRDRYMVKLHKRYPHYGFNKHKGYGTKMHTAAIKKYGLSEVHRLTFTRKYISVNSKSKTQKSKVQIKS